MVRKVLLVLMMLGLWWGALLNVPIAHADSSRDDSSIYEERAHHNPDGIGKFYLGREIAQVMGYEGAGWLERSGRDAEEQPQKVITALQLKPTDVVADIGAGTGYFSFRIAPHVPKGKVYAVDVQPEMIEILNYFKAEKNISNVEPILSSVTSPNLPRNGVDLALMVDVYHEFEFPHEMMSAIATSVKPGGRIVLVEYRGENPFVMIKPLHKMTQRQVKKEMQAIGLTYLETVNSLPQQHVMIFQKGVA
jgi:ubiquinone/menaquinone biosynthesis C-methylase UbiE